VPRAELACNRVGDDGDGMVARLSRPALRLLSGSATRVGRQLVCPGVASRVVAHTLVGVGSRGGDLSCEVKTSNINVHLVKN
jgi:hypothetical protein